MGRFARTITVLSLVAVLLAGCGGTASQSQGTASAKELHVANQTSQTTYSEQPLEIDNCGAKGPAWRTTQRSVTTEWQVAAGVAFDQLVASETLSTTYSQFRSETESIEVEAPPNTDMEYTVRWTRESFFGQMLDRNDSKQAEYQYDVPIDVVILSSRDIGCANSTANVTSKSTDVPTSETGNEQQSVVAAIPTDLSQPTSTTSLSKNCISGQTSGVGGVVPLIAGDKLPKGCAAIVREISWSTHEAKVWYTTSLGNDLAFGQMGSWVVEGWTSPTGAPWGWMKTDACNEVARIEGGSLGSADWTVEFQHGQETCP